MKKILALITLITIISLQACKSKTDTNIEYLIIKGKKNGLYEAVSTTDSKEYQFRGNINYNIGDTIYKMKSTKRIKE